jgi:hypothetical protein
MVRHDAQGGDKAQLVAASSAITPNTPSPPAGMRMSATYWNDTLPPGVPGSTTNPMKAELTLTRDMPKRPPVCGNVLPCFSAVIRTPIPTRENLQKSAPGVAPTTIVVKSSLGGSTTVNGAFATNVTGGDDSRPNPVAGDKRQTRNFGEAASVKARDTGYAAFHRPIAGDGR